MRPLTVGCLIGCLIHGVLYGGKRLTLSCVMVPNQVSFALPDDVPDRAADAELDAGHGADRARARARRLVRAGVRRAPLVPAARRTRWRTAALCAVPFSFPFF